jgi:predicted metalloendopeptidase
VNGKLTLGENIGDLTGIAIAPVLDGFTGPQRFFIGYAQVWRSGYREEAMRQLVLSNPHSPPEFRVNGPLRNSPEFFEAFGVRRATACGFRPERG